MFWGGLRGAVALALLLIACAEDVFPTRTEQTLLVLAGGFVLFTLLVNGLTMSPLIVGFGLDRPSPVDRFALAYAERERLEDTAGVLEALEEEGAFLPSVLGDLRRRLERRRRKVAGDLGDLREAVEQAGASDAVAARIALAVEKGVVMRRFEQGGFTEPATKALLHSADVLGDALKRGEALPEERTIATGAGLGRRLLEVAEPLPLLGAVARRLWAGRLALDLEITRGLYLATRSVEATLARVAEGRGVPAEALGRVRARYARWTAHALERLERLSTQYPEYAEASQALLAERRLLRAEEASVRHLEEAGLLTEKALTECRRGLLDRERELHALRPPSLELAPLSLLRRGGPTFTDASEEALSALAAHLVSRTVPEGEAVVREGEWGRSMFLIARGAAGVTAGEEGVPLGTLGPGDFFGEIAVLLGGTRTATVRALTPLNLLELSRDDLDATLAESADLGERVRAALLPRVVGRHLAESPLLERLSPEQRDALARSCVVEDHPEGDVGEAAGAPKRLTYVAEGRLARAGAPALGEGELAGVDALLGASAPADVIAAEPTRVLVVPCDVMERFRRRNPATVDACRAAVADDDEAAAEAAEAAAPAAPAEEPASEADGLARPTDPAP